MNNNINDLNDIFEDNIDYEELARKYNEYKKEKDVIKNKYFKKQDKYLEKKQDKNKDYILTKDDKKIIWDGYNEKLVSLKKKYYGSIKSFNDAVNKIGNG